MLNQYALDYPTFPVNQRYFHLIVDPGGMLSRSLGMPSRNDKPPGYLGYEWFIGKRFCKSTSVFFNTLSTRIQSLDF